VNGEKPGGVKIENSEKQRIIRRKRIQLIDSSGGVWRNNG
jgi:hypothetical protein